MFLIFRRHGLDFRLLLKLFNGLFESFEALHGIGAIRTARGASACFRFSGAGFVGAGLLTAICAVFLVFAALAVFAAAFSNFLTIFAIGAVLTLFAVLALFGFRRSDGSIDGFGGMVVTVVLLGFSFLAAFATFSAAARGFAVLAALVSASFGTLVFVALSARFAVTLRFGFSSESFRSAVGWRAARRTSGWLGFFFSDLNFNRL